MFSRESHTTKKTFAFLISLVVCCGLLWLGANRNGNIIRLNDPETAQAEVLKHIPIGTDVRQAESILEKVVLNANLQLARNTDSTLRG